MNALTVLFQERKHKTPNKTEETDNASSRELLKKPGHYNFWCTTSVIIKWKRLFTTPSLKLLSFAATVSTFLPSMIQLVWSPTKHGFLYGLLNCSFAFYIFSFQGNGQTDLVWPQLMLMANSPVHYMRNQSCFHFCRQASLLSMFPLLKRDDLVLAYVAMYGLFMLLYFAPGGRKQTIEIASFYSYLKALAFTCSLFLHVVYMTATPPQKVVCGVVPIICAAVELAVRMKKDGLGYEGLRSTNNLVNPDFYNWNKVFVRYCDGASFFADVEDPKRYKVDFFNRITYSMAAVICALACCCVT